VQARKTSPESPVLYQRYFNPWVIYVILPQAKKKEYKIPSRSPLSHAPAGWMGGGVPAHKTVGGPAAVIAIAYGTLRFCFFGMNEYPGRFAFGIVENSMRIMVDGDDIRVAFSKDLQREPLSFCDQAVAWLHYC